MGMNVELALVIVLTVVAIMTSIVLLLVNPKEGEKLYEHERPLKILICIFGGFAALFFFSGLYFGDTILVLLSIPFLIWFITFEYIRIKGK